MEDQTITVVNGQVQRGEWISTFTGKQFWLTDPRPEDVCIEDIAHALANIGRFTGHAKRFYSVAEHSLKVAELVDARFKAWALLHDAAEAYVGDASSPLKRSAGMEAYRSIEDRILRCVFEQFGLHHGGDEVWIPPQVKEVDVRMLMTEKRDLMSPDGPQWFELAAPYDFEISKYPESPAETEKRFLLVARGLGIL